MSKISTKTIERIKKLRKQGKSEREIAKLVGHSRSGVWGVLNR